MKSFPEVQIRVESLLNRDRAISDFMRGLVGKFWIHPAVDFSISVTEGQNFFGSANSSGMHL